MVFRNPSAGIQGAPRSKFVHSISSSVQVGDLYAYMVAQGYKGEQDVYFEIQSGGQAYPATTADGGIDCVHGDWPVGTRIWVFMRSGGEITGRGGPSTNAAGGDGVVIDAQSNGVAFFFIMDSGSELNGGGGAGGATGGGGSCQYSTGKTCTGSVCTCTGGSGGAGYGPNAAASGSNGGSCSCPGCGSCSGGVGYAGGTKGTAGTSGGAAGAASSGLANAALWDNNATVNGTEG